LILQNELAENQHFSIESVRFIDLGQLKKGAVGHKFIVLQSIKMDVATLS